MKYLKILQKRLTIEQFFQLHILFKERYLINYNQKVVLNIQEHVLLNQSILILDQLKTIKVLLIQDLRFDDTNPEKEFSEFIDNIKENLRFLGYMILESQLLMVSEEEDIHLILLINFVISLVLPEKVMKILQACMFLKVASEKIQTLRLLELWLSQNQSQLLLIMLLMISLKNQKFLSYQEIHKKVRIEDHPDFWCVAPGKIIGLKQCGPFKVLSVTVNEVHLERLGKDIKPKGFLHWLSVKEATPCIVRLYDYLFEAYDPNELDDYIKGINPNSKIVCSNVQGSTEFQTRRQTLI